MTTTELIDDIETDYATATNTWVTADWTHEHLGLDGSGYTLDGGDVVYCDGGDGKCQTCVDAAESAALAEDIASSLMTDIRSWRDTGDLAEHTAHIRCEAARVASIEREFGDAPTWGGWARAVAALCDEIDNASEDEAE
jgi:hypothetical protein